jgi:hypothetical protein
MATKNFGSTPEARRPRAVTSDPAYNAAAFPQQQRQEPEPEARTRIVAPSLAPPTIPKQPEKMSVYPRAEDRARLAHIKQMYRVGESFVVEYALERLFATTSDEAIVNEMRRRGHSLRRRPSVTATLARYGRRPRPVRSRGEVSKHLLPSKALYDKVRLCRTASKRSADSCRLSAK